MSCTWDMSDRFSQKRLRDILDRDVMNYLPTIFE